MRLIELGSFNRGARSPQGLGPSATSTNRKSKGDQSKTVQGDQQTATKPNRNIHRKQHLRSENWPQEGRKWHQQWPKYGPQRCPRSFQNDPQNARQTKNPTKTIRAPPWLPRWGGYPQFGATLWAPFWHPEKIQEEPKTMQNQSGNSRSEKKRSKTTKDPSWHHLGAFWGPMWRQKPPKSIVKHDIS